MAPTKIKATKVTAYPSLMVKLMMASLKLGNWRQVCPSRFGAQGLRKLRRGGHNVARLHRLK